MRYSIGANVDEDYLEVDDHIITQSECLGLDGIRLIKCNTETKTISVIMNGIEEDFGNSIQCDQIVDTEDGVYVWSGCCRNGIPFGYGCITYKNEKLVYEGFYAFNTYVCYGSVYYPGGKKLEYKGTLYNGRMCGEGEYYSIKGKCLHNGNLYGAVMDQSLFKKSVGRKTNISNLSSTLEYLYTSDSWRVDSYEVIKLYGFEKLKMIRIGNYNFSKSDGIKIGDCPELRFLMFGDECFTKYDDFETQFEVTDCPLLEYFTIGNNSFRSVESITLQGSPSESIFNRSSFLACSIHWRS